ncbi:Putative cysteine proteinase CG12163 [Sergentomyia squamirostris]
MLFKKKVIFFIFLTYVAVNCVLAGEVDDASVKNDKIDATSAEERDSVPSGALELEHEVINEQADQPSSGERFVAVHVDKMGEREELSPTLLGLTHLGLTFLPAEYQFLTVISAAREVVAGVRFFLEVNAERVETGERVVCTMEILEKPWITTEWGEKWRMLEFTNCTGSPNPLAPDRNQYNQVNPVFTDRPKVVTEEKLREIEDQIITTTTPRDYYVIHNASTNLPAELPDEMKALLDAYFLSSKPPPAAPVGPVRQYVPSVGSGIRPEVVEAKIEPNTVVPVAETPVTTDTYEITTNPTEIPQFINQDDDLGQQQQILDPFFSIDPAQFPANGNVQETERQRRDLLGTTKTEETLFQLNRALEQVDAVDEDTDKRVAIEIFHLKETKEGPRCKVITAQAHVANSLCDENDVDMRKCMENVDLETSKLCVIEVSLCDSKSPKLKKTACKPLPEKKVKEKRNVDILPALGAPQTIDTESDEIKELVSTTLVSFNTKENNNYELHRIVSATKQVVQGWAYKIKVEFRSKSPEEVVQCDVDVWQRPWLKQDSSQTEMSCDKHQKKYTFRAKRSVEAAAVEKVGRPVVVGGRTPVDVEKDEKIKELVSTTLVSFNSKENDNFELHRIVSATRQVVAGSRYDIVVEFKSKSPEEVIQCELSVWERPWLKVDNSQQTDISCDNEKKKYTFRSRRSVETASEPVRTDRPLTVPGGPIPIDLEKDRKVPELVKNTLTSFNTQEDGNFELHRIVSATKKMVSGTLYEIKVEFKSKKPDNVVECDISVWERPWITENGIETNIACDNNKKKHTFRSKRSLIKSALKSRSKRDHQLVGGPRAIDDFENDSKVQDLVKNSLVSFNTKEDNNFELHRIISATRKVVSGALYEIKVEFKSKSPEEVIECNLSIWEKPWLKVNNGQTEISCENPKKKYTFRSKRSIGDNLTLKGGPKPIQDIENDPEVQDYVKNSLDSFNANENDDYDLHRIVSGTKQTVAGSLYDIKLELKKKSTGAIIMCTLNIWERLRPDENNPKMDISCPDIDRKYTLRAKRSLIYDHRGRTTDNEESVLEHQRNTLAHHEELFHKFQHKYERAYHSSMEKSLRFRIFTDNLARIQQLNERERGTAKYGITEFADLTPTEYRMRTGLMKRDNDEDVNHIPNPIAEIPNFKLPKSFDWREKGVVSEVKNQGNCGSCWAFSVVGNIEGVRAVMTGNLSEYSEQELLDCDTLDGGCAGGLPDNAYKAIEQIGGLELESDYPYKARKGECTFSKPKVAVRVKGAVDLPKNETAMALYLVQNGPISIGINANAMQFYRGGISHPWKVLCRHSSIDHGVLIVGYGVAEYPLFNKTLPYWIVKNSWGRKWGEQGYYRVFRGDNTCGVSEMASSAVVID